MWSRMLTMLVDINQNHVRMGISHAIQAEILYADKDATKPSLVATSFVLFGEAGVGKLL